jgi:mRNA-degrading endonuclease RelE of RelBE toxin-antitoxin system
MYQSVFLTHFLSQLKPLNKKYRTLANDVADELDNFRPEHHPHLGNNIYKIRLRSKSLPKGKSKSFRLIIVVIEYKQLLVPITVYFKGDQSDISKKELNDHLEIILFELRAQNLLR